jgi:hypothetical protein
VLHGAVNADNIDYVLRDETLHGLPPLVHFPELEGLCAAVRVGEHRLLISRSHLDVTARLLEARSRVYERIAFNPSVTAVEAAVRPLLEGLIAAVLPTRAHDTARLLEADDAQLLTLVAPLTSAPQHAAAEGRALLQREAERWHPMWSARVSRAELERTIGTEPGDDHALAMRVEQRLRAALGISGDAVRVSLGRWNPTSNFVDAERAVLFHDGGQGAADDVMVDRIRALGERTCRISVHSSDQTLDDRVRTAMCGLIPIGRVQPGAAPPDGLEDRLRERAQRHHLPRINGQRAEAAERDLR